MSHIIMGRASLFYLELAPPMGWVGIMVDLKLKGENP
jgi:hypothetical protein